MNSLLIFIFQKLTRAGHAGYPLTLANIKSPDLYSLTFLPIFMNAAAIMYSQIFLPVTAFSQKLKRKFDHSENRDYFAMIDVTNFN